MRLRPTLALTAAVLVTAACSTSGSASAQPAELTGRALVSDTAAADALGGDAPAEGMALLAANTAVTHFDSAPAVVVCDGSQDAVARGTEIAVAAGVPLLCGEDPASFAGTIDALGADTALTIPSVDAAALEEASGVSVIEVPADASVEDVTAGNLGEEAPRLEPAQDLPASTVFATDDLDAGPARATAQAAGATVVVTPVADPRATSESVAAASDAGDVPVVALGDGWGDQERFDRLFATAATGVELPGGGQLVVPGKTYIALYGTPGTGALGLLGEQDVPATIERAEEVAGDYEGLTGGTTVVPTLEIIASVASAAPTTQGNYSNVQDVDELRPLIDAAAEADQYVVIDLQPGRDHFLEQAQIYEELLALPHVGLALDPEWRLKPDQVHLRQVGQVQVEEVNEVVDWLAEFTAERNLPQKVLMLHAFQNRMIVGLDDVDQSHDELEIVVHVDGQGGQEAKQNTWRTLHDYAPSIDSWGWKNFIDEDIPMLTPEQTMERVEPQPVFVSYQ